MSGSGNNPRNPEKALETPGRDPNFRKNLKFISGTLNRVQILNFNHFGHEILQNFFRNPKQSLFDPSKE